MDSKARYEARVRAAMKAKADQESVNNRFLAQQDLAEIVSDLGLCLNKKLRMTKDRADEIRGMLELILDYVEVK